MPKPSTPVLYWSEANQIYILLTPGSPEKRFGSEDGLSLLNFLETHTSFSFQGREGRLSVIKETRPRGTGYWYAYRSPSRRTIKRYLGVASNVTITHLEEAAGMLTRATRGIQTTQEQKETVTPHLSLTRLLLPKRLPPRLPSSLVARPYLLQQLDTAIEHALVSRGQHSDPSTPFQPLLDYFVTEILNTQPERLQQFLLQTSVLSRLSCPLCDAVTCEEDSSAQLAAIAQAGLFLESLDGEGGWYRFHALFSEALCREATHRLGEEALRVLSLRASHWYEQHAMTTEAKESALLAQNFERTVMLIERMGMDGQMSELYSVGQWLEQMPEIILRAHPMLCWLAALARLMFQEEASISEEESQRIEVLLQMAEEGWNQQGKQARLGLITAIHAMRAWRSALFPGAMEYAQKAIPLLLDDTQDYHIQMFRGICLFIVGTGFMYDGRFVEARSSFLEAHMHSLIGDDRHFKRGLLLLIGSVQLPSRRIAAST